MACDRSRVSRMPRGRFLGMFRSMVQGVVALCCCTGAVQRFIASPGRDAVDAEESPPN